jgi:hypothetical protein
MIIDDGLAKILKEPVVSCFQILFRKFPTEVEATAKTSASGTMSDRQQIVTFDQQTCFVSGSCRVPLSAHRPITLT